MEAAGDARHDRDGKGGGDRRRDQPGIWPGRTILRGVGAGSGKKKEVVICACDNKQIHRIKRAVHERDPRAFTIILESGEVVGEGFSRAN